MQPSNKRPIETTTADESIGSRERPAIGAFVSGDLADVLIRIVYRARERNHAILVAHIGELETELARSIENLGARLVPIDLEGIGQKSPRKRLISVARQEGFPGLVIHTEPDEFINYDLSLERLTEGEEYAIDAETVTSLPSRRDRTIAAIPAYNEERTIERVVEETSRYVDSVLVINDGSDDATAECARAAGATVVSHDVNSGYGAALKTAFSVARRHQVKQLVVLDADSQHDPADISKLLAEQENSERDIVIGSRFVATGSDNAPTVRRLGLIAINALANLSLRLSNGNIAVRDTQSGFRVYSARAIESLAEDDGIGDGMRASIDIFYHADARGYDVTELGTTVQYGTDSGGLNPIRHGAHLLETIVKQIERRHPAVLLGTPGLVFLFAGVLLGSHVFTGPTSGFLGVFPTAVISVGFVVFGLLACIAVVVFHVLDVYHGRSDFS